MVEIGCNEGESRASWATGLIAIQERHIVIQLVKVKDMLVSQLPKSDFFVPQHQQTPHEMLS